MYPSTNFEIIIFANDYSGTSRKRPPNMSSPGGHLQEVVAYESLDHIGS